MATRHGITYRVERMAKSVRVTIEWPDPNPHTYREISLVDRTVVAAKAAASVWACDRIDDEINTARN